MAKAEKAPPAERRLRLAASARRAQLVDVGRKVFAERGYEATSVEEIAERAGISKPIVYEHFGGKEGLYAVIVDREIEQIVSCITEATVLLRDAPASKSGGEMPALMHDLADRVGAIFTEQFRRAGYDAKTAPIYAHALVGMVAFVGQWWTESRKPPPVEAVAAHIAALAWMGLRHLPKRPTLLATTGRRS